MRPSSAVDFPVLPRPEGALRLSVPPALRRPASRLSARARMRSLARAAALVVGLAVMPGLSAQSARTPAGPGGLPTVTASTMPVTPSAVARPGAQRVDRVEVELIADVAQAKPGEPFRIGVRIAHDPHWHTYWRVPGDSGLPTQFDPVGPSGTRFGEIAWPAPGRYAIGPFANFGYEGEIVLSRTASLPVGFDGTRARFEVLAQWLVCRDVCIPGEAALSVDVPVGDRVVQGTAGSRFVSSLATVPDPSATRDALWWQDGSQAAITLPQGMQARRAEFFPYFEGVVRPVAAQTLATDGERLVLRLETVDAAVTGAAPPEPAAGLLVVDGQSIALRLSAAAAAPAATPQTLAVAEALRPPADSGRGFGSSFGSGLLDRVGQMAGISGGAGVGGASVVVAGPGDAGGNPFGLLSLVAALVGAFIGGLLLNLMPCVFPVIGLKLLGFAHAGQGDARIARRHALAFSAGVIGSFALLGIALVGLRLIGQRLGWGFQLQSPLFVALMALLFVGIALNLFGVFEAGLGATRLVPETRGERRGRGGSFATGVVAVLVATPCTAPFMGSAVGYTLTSPPLVTLLVFVVLGVGMALPYLALAGSTTLMRRLPRPGPWLVTFRQLLAFPMLATAAWLAWVLTLQAGADGLLRLLGAAILVGFIGWIVGRAQTSPRAAGSTGGLVWGVMAVFALVAGIALLLQIRVLGGVPSETSASLPVPGAVGAAGQLPGAATGVSTAAGWQPWSAERVAEARRAGQPVFVDFTAAWCISCQANKKLVLERDAVRKAFAARGVVLLRADWTRADPAITRELARFGRNGVPLYLLYPAGRGEPVLLPELLTQGIVLSALGRAR